MPTGTKGVPRADREAQILDAADRRFGTDGYAATSVDVVAREAGISKPLVYQYFGAKDALFAACLRRATGTLVEAMEHVARGPSVGLERGLLTLAAVFGTLEPRPYTWRLIFDASAPTDGPTREARQAYQGRIVDLARDGVGEMLTLAGVTDALDRDAMTVVWLRIVDALVDWWLDHPGESADDMVQRAVRLISAVSASPPSAI
ncbi:TetR/AcrR family transcriptional regulator [Solicola sp. PLA-1-18]|uniref:TetR/AcrR family transcriptional regulator n=1 Tax=Solicola sp. PLA-1-18 TaxID=3380532 RepID=UPI003B772151